MIRNQYSLFTNIFFLNQPAQIQKTYNAIQANVNNGKDQTVRISRVSWVTIFLEGYESHPEKTNILVSDLFDTNQAVQLQKMATGLKFRIKKVEGSYYLSSENKCTDLRLCFRICKTLVFS